MSRKQLRTELKSPRKSILRPILSGTVLVIPPLCEYGTDVHLLAFQSCSNVQFSLGRQVPWSLSNKTAIVEPVTPRVDLLPCQSNSSSNVVSSYLFRHGARSLKAIYPR